ncbi:MAG: TlpA family protein disulfide reductase [Proteobacteria bacterium]|nr:TlpA family protein disulfide reductase [Pseudomonadota bacterium]
MKNAVCVVPLLIVLLVQPLLCHGGQAFPDFSLQGELTQEHRQYLGVDSPLVRLSEVQAEYLFIEVYSLYCAPCQREAPTVNEMYETTIRTGLGSTVKFLGIAAGNTPYEVEVFREQFQVEFPLFSDEDYVVHEAIGNMGTPYFVLVRVGGTDNLEVLYAHEGAPEQMEGVYEEMIRLAIPSDQ